MLLLALWLPLSCVSRDHNDLKDRRILYIVNARLTVLVKIELPYMVGLLYDNASVGPFLVVLEHLITMDYLKPLTPNFCGYSVSGFSDMTDFTKHSLAGLRITEERLPTLPFFTWLAVGFLVRMGINNMNNSHVQGSNGTT